MKKTGFTLIELIVVIAIFAVLGAMVIFGFNFFQNKNRVEAAAREIASTLRLAQNKTLASEGNSSYGVHFETDKFVLFKGLAYIDGAADNSEHNLAQNLSIFNISLGGGADVVFARLSGATDNFGSATVGLAGDASNNVIIYIDESGVVDWQTGGASDSGRLKDSRHAHALYNQNTQSSVNLVLNFPDDSFSQSINYQTYLNPGKTEFFWEGSVIVAGSPQVLKIHSHWLAATSTEFCVHRDRRFNSKALQINLDGQNIINFTATGTTTPGTSVWAGMPEEQ